MAHTEETKLIPPIAVTTHLDDGVVVAISKAPATDAQIRAAYGGGGGSDLGDIDGIVKADGNGNALQAIPGSDYVVPSGSIDGNAQTASFLQTARNINGVPFNGTNDITVTAAASTLTGTVPTSKGGLGADNSAASGIPVFASGTSTVTAATGTGAPVRASAPTLTDPVSTSLSVTGTTAVVQLALTGGGNGMSFQADAGGYGLGFNRNAKTGAIYNSGMSAFQIVDQSFGFEIQNYNGAGTFQGRTILNGGNFAVAGTAGAVSATNRLWVNGNANIGAATGVTAPTNGLVVGGDAVVTGTFTLNNGKVLTLGGNLTTSGVFATTLTATATTSVTLPTTGTLATLAGSEALTNKSVNGVTLTTGGSSAAFLNGAGAYVNDWFPTVAESTTARTLALTDSGKYIRLTNASGCAITVPPDSGGGSVAWVADTEIEFRVAALGAPSIVEGSGVTVNNKTAAAALTQHQTFALKHVGTNLWDLI